MLKVTCSEPAPGPGCQILLYTLPCASHLPSLQQSSAPAASNSMAPSTQLFRRPRAHRCTQTTDTSAYLYTPTDRQRSPTHGRSTQSQYRNLGCLGCNTPSTPVNSVASPQANKQLSECRSISRVQRTWYLARCSWHLQWQIRQDKSTTKAQVF